MEEHRLAGPEHKLERLIFFSDAVFAIAITLLVIEIHAPHLPFGTGAHDYAMALLHELPSFGGFVISFFVIGAFWAAHHRTFALARHWSDTLIAPNLMLLAAIAAMPFFTAFMSGNATGRVPVMLYCAWLIVAGLLNVRLQRVVTTKAVLDPAATGEATIIRRRGYSVILGATLSLILCAVVPYPSIGLMGLMSIGLWRRVLTRGLAHG